MVTLTLPYLFPLTVGDLGDGHERKEMFLFSCSHSRKDVIAAFEQASQQHNLRLDRECDDAEVNHLTPEFRARYLKVFSLTEEEMPAEHITPIMFVGMYMKIASLAIPSMSATGIELDEHNIGGYGLFLF